MPRRKRVPSSKPKRSLTAYMFFCQATRPELKKTEPNLTFGEVGKKLGSMWKALSEEEKKPYVQKATKAKGDYVEAYKEYKVKHPNSSDDEKPARKKRKKRKKKDPNAPKKPCSAFFFFSKKQRPQIRKDNPEATFGEIGKLIGAAWRALSEDDREPFKIQAAEAKKLYAKKMESYVPPKSSSSSSSSSSSEEDTSSSDSSSSSEESSSSSEESDSD
eukprot:TRINITY_DN2798_c0_g1_i1.p1 TRINITY_DN2798_c0_g1~~TRINITY_DN2798_c0_g1_i1.p1  ORF type:complete len:217 (+),score=51.08 TRINITY_DN2798_c0_g1_i1:136-786(+)